MNRSTCKSCGASIVWIRTRSGRSMPCDAKPVNYCTKPGGSTKLVTPAGDVISCEPVDDPAEATGWAMFPTGAPATRRTNSGKQSKPKESK